MRPKHPTTARVPAPVADSASDAERAARMPGHEARVTMGERLDLRHAQARLRAVAKKMVEAGTNVLLLLEEKGDA